MFVRETEQRNIDLSLEKEEFEPAVFQLCADNQKVCTKFFLFQEVFWYKLCDA